MKIKTTKFTFIFRLLWFVTIISIMFINTENRIMVYSVIAALLILTAITVIRSLESRNQWRRMIEDGEVEVKDKISLTNKPLFNLNDFFGLETKNPSMFLTTNKLESKEIASCVQTHSNNVKYIDKPELTEM